MNPHLPHHIPHLDPETRALLAAVLRVVALFAVAVLIWWVLTYGGGPIGTLR